MTYMFLHQFIYIYGNNTNLRDGKDICEALKAEQLATFRNRTRSIGIGRLKCGVKTELLEVWSSDVR